MTLLSVFPNGIEAACPVDPQTPSSGQSLAMEWRGQRGAPSFHEKPKDTLHAAAAVDLERDARDEL